MKKLLIYKIFRIFRILFYINLLTHLLICIAVIIGKSIIYFKNKKIIETYKNEIEERFNKKLEKLNKQNNPLEESIKIDNNQSEELNSSEESNKDKNHLDINLNQENIQDNREYNITK